MQSSSLPPGPAGIIVSAQRAARVLDGPAERRAYVEALTDALAEVAADRFLANLDGGAYGMTPAEIAERFPLTGLPWWEQVRDCYRQAVTEYVLTREPALEADLAYTAPDAPDGPTGLTISSWEPDVVAEREAAGERDADEADDAARDAARGLS
jgi:hypothetical protein